MWLWYTKYMLQLYTQRLWLCKTCHNQKLFTEVDENFMTEEPYNSDVEKCGVSTSLSQLPGPSGAPSWAIVEDSNEVAMCKFSMSGFL